MYFQPELPSPALRLARTPRDPGRRGGPARIALYSHDTMGFGHWRRNLLLAKTLRAITPAPDVLLIAGMREAGAFNLPEGADCLTLPAYDKSSSGSYQARSLGLALNELASLREATIEAALMAYQPDLFIVDNVPRGAQLELGAVLTSLRATGRTRIVLGMRDVIDAPEVVRAQWLRQRNFSALRAWYDEVWIYGDPAFYDLCAEYDFGESFDSRARFMGYLDQRDRIDWSQPAPALDDPRPYVLCTVGGGRDGGSVCRAFAAARMPAGHRGILLTGSQLPSDERVLIEALVAQRDDMEIVKFASEPLRLMDGAARVVAMGGYNTVTELLALGRPALIAARSRPRQEQVLRARRLAEKGLLDMIPAEELTTDSLSDWLAGPVAPRSGQARSHLDMGGLNAVRTRAAALLEETAAASRKAIR